VLFNITINKDKSGYLNRNKKMEGQINCADCNNKACFVQQFCSPNWMNIISEAKNQLWYKKGQYIFREGDRIFGLYFIERGKVKIISTGLNNKEQIVRLAVAGHVIGHRGQGNETYPIGAVALEDTQVCFLDNEIVYEAFMNNPKFTFALMMFYSSELRKTEIRERHLAQMTIREKIADTLLYLKETFGISPADGSLNANLSRQELAEIAGTSVEQVIRELTDFENEKLINKEGRKIVLFNLDGLVKIVAPHNKNRYSSSWEAPKINGSKLK